MTTVLRARKGNPSHLSLKRQFRSSLTSAEAKLWFHIRAKRFESLKFKRQHGIGPYIVDYYCAEKALVIEVDGDVHAGEVQKERDESREDYLKRCGLRILRYNNQDILKNIEGVLENLRSWVLG